MASTEKTKFAAFQAQMLWIALACFAASFLLDSKWSIETFGNILLIVKQANAVIMWLGAILSGKKLLDLFKRVQKATEEVQMPPSLEENNPDPPSA